MKSTLLLTRLASAMFVLAAAVLPLHAEGNNEPDVVAESSSDQHTTESQESQRYFVIKGTLEIVASEDFSHLTIWCHGSDDICIVILQPGVDDRTIVRAPDAPADSPLRYCTVGDYSISRSTAGTAIELTDVKPLER